MGHALTMTIEDMLIRWRRMLGHRTLWIPGTDHAGIATQMVVERDLKKRENKTRHDIGREDFLKQVWQWKAQHGDRIANQQRILGCSLDWSRHHFTLDEDLSYAVREAFVQLFNDHLIYRAERLVNWCPRCQTALSDLEVEHDESQPGELWSFAYPIADLSGDTHSASGTDEIVVATTRPETMLGDTGVAVHPDDPRYKSLIGKHVVHPLLGYRIPIIADAELVDPAFGTGAVKVTPAHDFNDFATGKRHALTLLNIFDSHACILNEPETHDDLKQHIDLDAWSQYAGLDRYEARTRIKANLEQRGLGRGSQEHPMAIGHCQRCTTTVEPALSLQWWVKTESLAKPAIQAVRDGATKIIPETWTKTYYHWMENIQDWCISRQLWWGHRIPAWYCIDCDPSKGKGEARIFGADAKPMVTHEAPTACSRCGGNHLVQEADVLDTWFSSGLWPFSTLGWPNKTPDLDQYYPNTVMETGFDILFFWVARMMMMGCHFMDKPPFPTIYLHAMVRDRQGNKMSKTRGNVIDPLHLIHGCNGDNVSPQFKDDYPKGFPAFGTDALRFALAAMSGSGRDIRLSVERIAGYRAFANKIWNAARFVMMRLDGAQPHALSDVTNDLENADRYILSKLATATDATNTALSDFKFAEAANAMYHFFWNEFCDWYIELVKHRLMGDDGPSKSAAQATLVYVLDHALRLLHPAMPFITEEIWQKLPQPEGATRPASIMIAKYPVDLAAQWHDETVERAYALVQDAIVAIRTIRSESNVAPSKQVCALLIVPHQNDRALLEQERDVIEKLARTQELRIEGSDAQRPKDASIAVRERMEVVVPLTGLVDFAQEAQRLEHAIGKAQKEHERLAKKLSNPSFIKRAPAEVVTKDRNRAADLESMIAKLTQSLQRCPK